LTYNGDKPQTAKQPSYLCHGFGMTDAVASNA
jgi:hypothetical protein